MDDTILQTEAPSGIREKKERKATSTVILVSPRLPPVQPHLGPERTGLGPLAKNLKNSKILPPLLSSGFVMSRKV